MTALDDQIVQFEAAIAAQEALRPTLGDAAVDTIVTVLRDKLDALRAQAGTRILVPRHPESLLERLIPKELASKMRAMGHIEGERKQVTVMFADISGFTALSERLDPEEVTDLTSEALKVMAEAVYAYEGYIDKFVGDAIMAVFGAPITHEDDPERALHAALAMRERLAAFNRHWIERLGQPLSLHIGINTGIVIAGNVGSDLRLSYTVMGDTVNTAARLEAAAQAGQILASRDTYRLTQEAFTFIVLDPITVKGKREPLPVFEVQRAKVLPSKARGVKELGVAFVGREHALTQLTTVVNELAAGSGRLVSINGEAGIGKSRLLAEWLKALGGRVRWVEGRSFAHTTSLAFGPFIDMFRRYSRIRDEDTEAEARAKLESAVAQLLPDRAEAPTLFANLLAMRLTPEESALLANWSAEALRRHLFAVIRELFERLAHERPTIVIFEDIHWIDYTSLELIESLLPLAKHLPLALVGVRRLHPDERPSKLRQIIEAHYADLFTDVALTPLSDTSSLSMVEQLLSTSAIPDTLHAIILRKAEGNPFFVEEVIRSLIERGALMLTETGWLATPLINIITVPDTVQGVLMSRLDALPDETKWLIQQASVIGRIFFYRVLWHMAEQSAGIDNHLARLEREELIRERVRMPEVEYIFKHALTQEVAYQSLLAPRRKELHRRVGEALEAIFAERIGEFQSIIGEHFLRGGVWDKAANYLGKAGDAAARLYAHPEARLHYMGVLDALSHLPDDDDNGRRRVDAITKQVSVSFAAEDPTQVLARLTEAESLAKALSDATGTTPDRLRLARVHYWIGRSYFFRNKLPQAVDYFAQVLAAEQELDDPGLYGIASSAMGRTMVFEGQWDKAEHFLAQAASPLAKVANWYDWILSIGFLGAALAARGQYTAGVAEGERALARAQEINHLTAIGGSHITRSLIYLMGGDWQCMLEESRATVAVAEQSGDRLWVFMGLGLRAWAENRLGDYESASKSMAQSQAMAQSLGGHIVFADWFATTDAHIAFNVGHIEEAIVLATEAIALAKSNDGIFAEGLAHRVWGQALARLVPPQWDEAEGHLAESLRLLEAGDARLEAARTHAVWGEICCMRENVAAAHEHFEKAVRQFEVCGLTHEIPQFGCN